MKYIKAKFLFFLTAVMLLSLNACHKSVTKKELPKQGTVSQAWLDQEDIDDSVLVRKKRIGYCFQYFYGEKNPEKEKLALSWSIGSDGYVGTVRVQESSLGGSRVEQCIVNQVGRWKFRAAPNEQTMMAAHHFDFKNLNSL